MNAQSGSSQYKALAERIEQQAVLYDWLAEHSDEQRTWAADLRTVVSLLDGMAQEKPAMWVQSNHLSWAGKQPFMARCAPTQLHPDFVPLFTHPAPQPQPERQPLTDERIDEIGEPFGYFTYGDAQGDKRRAFVRAIESSHGIGYGKAIEGGPSELRSCTCHPDDNPPVPCAQKYALNECRAAQPERQPVSEPTEAQIEAAAKELCQCHAEGCGVDPDDEWKVYGEQFREEATRVLRAALAAKQPEPTEDDDTDRTIEEIADFFNEHGAEANEPTDAQIEAAMLTIRAELGVGFFSYSTEKNLAGAVLRAALAAREHGHAE